MKKIFYISAAIIPLLILSVLFLAPNVKANPQGFYQSFIGTNTATTSITYMTGGTATTTIYWDAGFNGASAQGSESAIALVQFTASSTSSTLQVYQEFSQGVPGVNCVSTPTACDWYQMTPTALNGYATTTADVGYNLSTVPLFSWKFASSTIGQIAQISTNNLDTRAITIQTPTRYTRLNFVLKPITNGNGAVWADIVAKKQNP